MRAADAAEEALRQEFDLLVLGQPSAFRIAEVRLAAASRHLVERLAQAAIDGLDAIDRATSDLEDDDREGGCEDAGVVEVARWRGVA